AIWNEIQDNVKISDKRAFAIKRASQMSFEMCKIPIHQQINAALGLYKYDKCERIAIVIQRHILEYKRLKGLIEKATTIEEIDNILLNHHYHRI
ncbi:MAG: hypothetical protein M9949_01780, partial [Candidatus Kapabacteria bacterium]|nr:hypothetical protein [Candidatus Kapabacteria bacterium]